MKPRFQSCHRQWPAVWCHEVLGSSHVEILSPAFCMTIISWGAHWAVNSMRIHHDLPSHSESTQYVLTTCSCLVMQLVIFSYYECWFILRITITVYVKKTTKPLKIS